jgi:hypothetical protein
MSVVNLTGTDQAVVAGKAVYQGFTIRETAGAAAVVRIFDNASAASGPILEEISLAANASAAEHYPGGIEAFAGIYVDVVSGAVSGSVRIR